MTDNKKLADEIKKLKQIQNSLFQIAKTAHTVKDSFKLYKERNQCLK